MKGPLHHEANLLTRLTRIIADRTRFDPIAPLLSISPLWDQNSAFIVISGVSELYSMHAVEERMRPVTVLVRPTSNGVGLADVACPF